ncbi:MAG: cryptochrome/photolyase family protein [Parvibaculales bacterium]
MSQHIIVWFRQDLRLNDNLALQSALNGKNAVIPVFIDDSDCGRQPGIMGRWWRDKSLAQLNDALKSRGSRLVFRKGRAQEVLPTLAKQVGATAVYWNRQYEADIVARDTAIKSKLKDSGIEAESFNGSLLFEPWEVTSKSTGGPFKVFTPFWRACCALGLKRGLWDAPEKISAPAQWPQSDALPATAPLDHMDSLNIWQPGEDGARDALALFLSENISGYAERRNLPAEPATSRLSPHLRWGEISPARIVAETEAANIKTDDGTKFLSELGWREFSYQLLYHNPELAETCLQNKFEAFPWRNDADAFEAWKRGETGYPIVDAGMRELRRTGYMHNRVRMIAASFLIKHLLIDWREGEKWFWECLVDADPANNSASWQWVAGCGADAAPYFRIFNPILQGPKFDADGIYTKTYVPELSALSGKTLYAPWTAKSDMLDSGAISLGDTYPNPIVNHEAARARALESFKSL